MTSSWKTLPDGKWALTFESAWRHADRYLNDCNLSIQRTIAILRPLCDPDDWPRILNHIKELYHAKQP